MSPPARRRSSMASRGFPPQAFASWSARSISKTSSHPRPGAFCNSCGKLASSTIQATCLQYKIPFTHSGEMCHWKRNRCDFRGDQNLINVPGYPDTAKYGPSGGSLSHETIANSLIYKHFPEFDYVKSTKLAC